MAGEYWLAMRADGFKGSGSAVDPWDASSPSLFNKLLYDLRTQKNITIHIGAGIFQVPAVTGDNPLIWQPRSGWRIVGAGPRATVLKIVNPVAGTSNAAILNGVFAGGEFLDGFTVEDLTVDCNIRGYPDLLASMVAISVLGRRLRIRGVRAVDFGTQTDLECFAIATGAEWGFPEARDCIIEDCIVEKPSPNNVRETSCIGLGSQEADDHGLPQQGNPSVQGFMAYHRSSVVRRNVVDARYSVDERWITQIIYSGTSATAKTSQPHNRKVGDWVVISGALVNSSPDNPYNGSFQVTSVSSAHEFSYAMQSQPTAEPTGRMWLGRSSSHYIAISALSSAVVPGGAIVTLTTLTPHFRVPGQNVRVQNVFKGTNHLVPSLVNGVHKISEVVSPTVLKFLMTVDPNNDFYVVNTAIGVQFHGFGVDGGIGAVGERNRIFDCRFGGPYHDTWSTKDCVVRKNYYYAVVTGPYHNMGGISGTVDGVPTRPATSLIRDPLDNTTAILTCGFIHGLTAGQAVQVVNARVQGNLINPFNGNFAVEKVLSPQSFTYKMVAPPTADADGPPAPRPLFGAIWQVGRALFCKNTIELIRNPIPGGAPSIGVAIANGTDVRPQHVYRQVLVRENIIRTMDGGTDTSSLGIAANWFENGIIGGNILGGLSPEPITFHSIGQVDLFNNQTASGQLIQGLKQFVLPPGPSVILNQLETEIDLSLTAGGGAPKN